MSIQSDIKEGLIQITKSKPMAYQLLRFLADNNCVIKVDRELPCVYEGRAYGRLLTLLQYVKADDTLASAVANEAQMDMLNNNWRCVESILGKDSPV